MVALEGRLVAEDLGSFAERLQGPPEGEGEVSVDLSGVTEIDSAGVALLAVTARPRIPRPPRRRPATVNQRVSAQSTR